MRRVIGWSNALRCEEVAQVHDLLPLGQGLLTDGGQGHHDLEADGLPVRAGLLQGGEAELAGVAEEDDAPGHRHGLARGPVGLVAVEPLTHLGQRVGA
ncbi:hypothetical protein, partial [Streptococcus pneumoniae]|uniref:hypothetical protein n=1 Tax=Streptococcus pneumoniae TaxID=1313 RepID=UPI001F512914